MPASCEYVRQRRTRQQDARIGEVGRNRPLVGIVSCGAAGSDARVVTVCLHERAFRRNATALLRGVKLQRSDRRRGTQRSSTHTHTNAHIHTIQEHREAHRKRRSFDMRLAIRESGVLHIESRLYFREFIFYAIYVRLCCV